MYVRTGRPAFAIRGIKVHKNIYKILDDSLIRRIPVVIAVQAYSSASVSGRMKNFNLVLVVICNVQNMPRIKGFSAHKHYYYY